jgi:hypothetical protein
MSNGVKIRIPYIWDDPLVGRIISSIPLPISIFNDFLIIENGILTYKHSITSSKTGISFKLTNIIKLLLRKRKVPCLKKDHKLDIWAGARIEIELSLLDIEGRSHVLISKVFIDRGQKNLDRFLSELCKYSGLPLEERLIDTD